jgi:4-hydroxy-tetrahydrodipicolinate synthase
VPNIIGVKEATGELDRVPEIRDLCGEDFDIFSGDDATSRELVLLGGKGSISVTANVAPAKVHEMMMAALEGDAELAAKIDEELVPLHRDLFLEANPIPVKWALAEMGRIPTGIRLPLTWLAEEAQVTLRQTLKQVGLV